ncbi:MAG: hypothetical protein CME65_03375 [Halobacteriovoraceae bacterium]|nr:hypothetical protein [Halobacteriovoraceae bacterium]
MPKANTVKLYKKTLTNEFFNFNAIAFIPPEPIKTTAVFTHGYTASKTDCVNWAQRLSDANIPTIIFDLPGHHLGSFNSVASFEVFKSHSYKCFLTAFNYLHELSPGAERLVLGGHSLGALLSVFALDIPEFQNLNPLAIGVGLGIGQHKTAHLFETSFYEKTLNIRRQLVDEKIDSDLVFPWIKEAKLSLDQTGRRIHLITGQDDVVVGEGGMEALAFQLSSNGNEVTTAEPRKLPHHEPAAAATHIYNFLKKELSLN